MNLQRAPAVFGGGEFLYEVDPTWPQIPEGWSFVEVAGVATDSQNRVYVFNRGEHPVMVFQADGTFVCSWGEGEFVRPHGIWIGPDDAAYLTQLQQFDFACGLFSIVYRRRNLVWHYTCGAVCGYAMRPLNPPSPSGGRSVAASPGRSAGFGSQLPSLGPSPRTACPAPPLPSPSTAAGRAPRPPIRP